MDESDANVLSGGEVPFEIPPYTVGQVIFKSLHSGTPDEVLIIEGESGRSITCFEYLLLSIKVAEALKELDFRSGDRAVLAGKNGIEICAAATATLFAGGTISPVDPTMKPFEFQQILQIIEPKIIFCDPDITPVISETVQNLENDVTVVTLLGEPNVEYPVTRFEDFIKGEVDFRHFRPVPKSNTSESIAVLACSSGTTGLPKAVMLSDRSLIFQLLSMSHIKGNEHKGKSLWLHLSHFFWITGIILFLGCTCGLEKRVLVRNVTAQNILKVIDKYKPQVAFMPPAHLDMIVEDSDFENYDVASIKHISVGGAALQKSTFNKIKSKWPGSPIIIQGYGCTEVGGVITAMKPNQDIASVGQLIPGIKIKVLKEDGQSGGPGEIGELCVKSVSMMNGYSKNEEATRNAIDEDGWLHTGDTGYYNNNLVYICGRIKELIKYKGMQIAPAELEELIHAVPGVADVGIAGIKIDAYTYHPMAMVVKGEDSDVTEEDIVKCVNENLSDYKRLRGGICFVDEIPRTPTGKIKRKDLQTLADILYMDSVAMSNTRKNYICGRSLDKRLPDCSFAEYFIPHLKSHPKGNIIQVDAVTGHEETSEEVLKKSLQVSESYIKLGLSQDDTFCLLGKNCSRVYSAVLGVFWLGGILAPLDPDWNIHELQNMFKKIKPTAIICEVGVTEKVSTVLKNIGIQAKIIVLAEKNLIKGKYISFDELLETDVDVENYLPKPVESPSTKIALILPTSGTTGTSKGVGITHRNMIFEHTRFRQLDLSKEIRSFLVNSHFFWITCFFSLMASLYNGGKKVYMTEINPENVLNAIHKYKPEFTLMSPALFGQTINHPDVNKYDLSSLKLILLGGSPLIQANIDDAKKIWKDQLPLVNVYGATELSGALTCTKKGENILCCGQPALSVKIKIVDPDTGKTLGVNEKGEVYAQCPGLMKGYVGDEEETKATIVDGWCRTGDLGYYDEEENLYVIGRLKEMIKDKGRQIAPSEIEGVIGSIPEVEEVGVAGIEKDSGEADLIGFVVKKIGTVVTENTIKNHVKDNLAEYKQLKRVVFVDKLPRTSTGKLRRKVLNEMAISSSS